MSHYTGKAMLLFLNCTRDLYVGRFRPWLGLLMSSCGAVAEDLAELELKS